MAAQEGKKGIFETRTSTIFNVSKNRRWKAAATTATTTTTTNIIIQSTIQQTAERETHSPGMNGLTACLLNGLQNTRDIEVRIRRCRRPDANGLIGSLDEGCLGIRCGIDRHGSNTQIFTCSSNTLRYFTPIRNEDFRKGGRSRSFGRFGGKRSHQPPYCRVANNSRRTCRSRPRPSRRGRLRKKVASFPHVRYCSR